MPRPCSTEDCIGEVGDRSDFDKCKNCRSYDKRWSKRKQPELIERQRQLHTWDHRLVPLIHGKITRMSAHRKRA